MIARDQRVGVGAGSPGRPARRAPMRWLAGALVCGVVLATGCGTAPASSYRLNLPIDRADGLGTGTPTDVSLDAAPLAEAAARIEAGEFGEVHSMLVLRDDLLVVEEYFPGHDYRWDGPGFHGDWVDWDEADAHNVHSVGKSVTSAAVGIAIDLGHVGGVDDPIFDYLPDHRHLSSDGKDRITIEHLLTMTSGLAWDEWGTSYADDENDMIGLWLDCDDQVACVLEAPLEHEPGTAFTYSGGNLVVLGAIIEHATDQDIEAFTAEHLFGPLAIEPPTWGRFPSGVVDASADQHLTPRDMVKFGSTYLHGGLWDGRRVLSEDWVARSSTPFAESHWHNGLLRSLPPGDGTWGRRGYAYTWWTHTYSHGGEDLPSYFALGFGGQRIHVFPDRNAVVVFTAGNYGSADTTAEILTEFVIPALG